MKQILITPEIEKVAQTYANTLFADKRSDFVWPLKGLRNLIIDLKEVNKDLTGRDKYVEYVERIVRDYDDLQTLKPSNFEIYKSEYDKILKEEKLSGTVYHRGRDLPDSYEFRKSLKVKTGRFYNEIVERMHYKDCRLYLAPLMKEIGINTCVYCNIYPAFSSRARREAYYPFDHYKPKSKYPFLCTCFYNLNPICPECNGHKLNDDENKGYQLFVEKGVIRDPFVFKIDRKKIEEGNPQTVEVCFTPRVPKDKKLRDNYNEWYRIEDYYNDEGERESNYKMMKDIEKYRGSYVNATNASFPSIVDRRSLFLEVFGVKDDENIFTNLKKKLKIDTAKDAKLI